MEVVWEILSINKLEDFRDELFIDIETKLIDKNCDTNDSILIKKTININRIQWSYESNE